MGYRSLFISSACKLSVKNSQLIISMDIERSFPIEDIRTVMIESRAVSITAYALSELSLAGVCVFFCDEKHLPCALLQGFGQYTRRKQQLSLQINASKPLVKRIWQNITVTKIKNQAKSLELCKPEKSDYKTLLVLSNEVRSGDPDNLEGQAAAFYFKALFGSTFARSRESIYNIALNYGYSIIRGYICRIIADYGFEPSLGIHHMSQVNQFNLADDLIEPYRPIVDVWIWNNINPDENELAREEKAELTNLLNYEVISGGEKHSLAYSIERLVHSFERVLQGNENPDELLLPTFSELKRHEYE